MKKRIIVEDRQPLQQEEAYRLLKEKILKGEFPAGRSLPSIELLGRKYGIGRTPLHKAITRLAEDGLIASRAGSGCLVLPPKEIQLNEAQNNCAEKLQEALKACEACGMTFRDIDFVIDNFCRPRHY